MAFTIEKNQSYHSPLANAEFSRQVDICKLAKRGESQSRRLWNDFANECPAQARLVIAEAESHQAQTAIANKNADKVLSKAEKKKPSRKKSEKKLDDFASRNRDKSWAQHVYDTSTDAGEREAAFGILHAS